MDSEQLVKLHKELCKKARQLMVRKNHDYASAVSDDPFANFRGSALLGLPSEVGILLRIQDKMMRINTFLQKGELKADNESVDDALIDIINYVVLLKGMIEDNTHRRDHGI